MAYFLKKSKIKNGTYLQIYESFYDPKKKDTAHKSFKAIGYVEKLIADGMDDPIGYYTDIVKQMNEEAKRQKVQEKARQISESPERHLGFFPLKNIYDELHVSNFLDFLQSIRSFHFNVSELIEALVYSRIIDPCSKRKSLNDVFPKLYGKYSFSYDQVLEGIEFIGREYEKIIEIFNYQLNNDKINKKYATDTSTCYFDCTNFYFEIDKEDDFKMRGPSKENKNDPIVGLGLLLDKNLIPVGMKMYPGNESEKPVIREVVSNLKKRNNVSGRTIQVADKGLNCAENIIHALKNRDGYIFSKSVKILPETEKTWVLLENDYKDVVGADGKLLYKIKECVDEFEYKVTDKNGKKRSVKLTEKRVVTYNPKLAEKKRFEINKMIEKARILKASQAKKKEYGESSKYVVFNSADKDGNLTDGKIKISINDAAIKKDLELAGYNMIVTSETKMSADAIYSTYHNLWRIEESFKVMKSYLDARPVYLQKKDSIQGHFLICYISVLLLRLFQFKVLKNKYGTEEIISFMKDFRAVEFEKNKYINITSSSELIRKLAEELELPLTNYLLNEHQIKEMMG